MPRDYQYENNYSVYNKDDEIYEIKCKNYKICENFLPEWWYDCKEHYLCINCHMSFDTWGEQKGKGELEFKDSIECPICYNIDECVSYPRCKHFICLKCFKRNWYSYEDIENKPKFPYPDLEEEYFEEGNIYDKICNDPLILKYHEDYNKWDDEREEKTIKEEYLRLCPICRL